MTCIMVHSHPFSVKVEDRFLVPPGRVSESVGGEGVPERGAEIVNCRMGNLFTNSAAGIYASVADGLRPNGFRVSAR